MTCSKPFHITVTALSCPDWTAMFWGVPNIIVTGDGSAYFIPTNGSSDTFAGHSETFGTAGFNTASVVGQVSFSYAGPACNCQLSMNLIRSFGLLNMAGLISIGDQDNSYLFVDLFLTADGAYILPFTVADGTVTPRNITVQVAIAVNDNGPASADVTGTITNV